MDTVMKDRRRSLPPWIPLRRTFTRLKFVSENESSPRYSERDTEERSYYSFFTSFFCCEFNMKKEEEKGTEYPHFLCVKTQET